MSNVVRIERPAHLPHDASATLREVADAIDRNEVRNLVLAYEWAGQDGYQFVLPGTPYDSIALASMLLAFVQS